MYSLTPSRSEDGRSLARGNWKPIIRRSLKNPVRVKFIAKCIARVAKYELQKFCSSSLLRTHTVDSITNFKWKTILKKAKCTMPVLFEILSKCTETRTNRNNTDSIIGMVISIFAKHRQPHCCLAQKVISLILYSGHCSSKVSIIG